MNTVDIVIVNWNAGLQLQECVSSIFEHEDAALGVVAVVDNASADGSAEFARSDPRLRLLEPGRNIGFGSACNQGAAVGTADYILFLNPDTRFLRPTLGSVVSRMAQPAAMATAVCGIRLVGDRGQTWRHCSRLPTPAILAGISAGLPHMRPHLFHGLELSDFDHVSDADVPHVMGAFYLIRRSAFEKLGGFDERYFVYYEDIDLSLRVHEAGFKILYLASESVYHKGGGVSDTTKAKPLSYLLEGRLLFARKHFSTIGFVVVAAAIFLIEPVRRVAVAASRRSSNAAVEVLKGYHRLFKAMSGATIDRS